MATKESQVKLLLSILGQREKLVTLEAAILKNILPVE